MLSGAFTHVHATNHGLCFVQYDVELLRTVEGLIGHELNELKLEEREVLKGMTKVYKAKRSAMVRAQEEALRAESAGRPDRMARGATKKRSQ